MSINSLVVAAAALFELLPVRPTGDHHVRTWEIRSGDTIAGVMAYPTHDPERLLVHTLTALTWGGGTHYLSDWAPAAHLSLEGLEAVSVTRDGSRIITGKRQYGPGTVSVIDLSTGAALFEVPSVAFSTSGTAIWPWLSADGDAAALTIWSGYAPVQPNGWLEPVDGVVIWEEGSIGVRTIAKGAVTGASDDLNVLVVRNSSGRVVAYDRAGNELHEICAVPVLVETCEFRGLSPDGRYASVLDEGAVPHRRGLIDLLTGVEEPLPPRGDGPSWVAFDQSSERMLYARAAADHNEMVVRTMADGHEQVLDTGPYHRTDTPLGFVGGRYAVMGSWSTTFVDTEVISADGFDARVW